MKSMRYLWIFFALCCFTSCLRLDDNLFNPDTSITQYYFDDYEGEVHFELPPVYAIPQDKINLFTLTSDDGEESATIHAVYVGDIANIATDTVIMYCHGNADHMDIYWQRVKLLANMGGKNRFGVLMIDYRGYGLSTGKPTESGIYADVDAALQWLKQRGLTSERLVMYGFSLGTAPAVEHAAYPRSLKPSKLILESPFSSAETMVQDAAVLALPGVYFTDNKINNADKIRDTDQPLLWLHGVADDFLSIHTHGETVYKNHPGLKTAFRVEGAEHSTIPPVLGFETYMDIVLGFLLE